MDTYSKNSTILNSTAANRNETLNDQYKGEWVWKSHDNSNNGNDKTIKKPHTITNTHTHIHLYWSEVRERELLKWKRRTYILCVSNKIKYLTPFARKIQRPLFERTNKRNETKRANTRCSMASGFSTYRIRNAHNHTHTQNVMWNHEIPNKATAPFCRCRSVWVSWFCCVSATAFSTFACTQQALFAVWVCVYVCAGIYICHFYLLRC